MSAPKRKRVPAARQALAKPSAGVADPLAEGVSASWETRKAKEILEQRFRAEVDAAVAAEDWTPPPVSGSWRQQLRNPLPAVEYVVDELLPHGGSALLQASYKAGKTTASLNLAADLADGRPFLGRFATHLPAGRTVAYWNLEVDGAQVQQWLSDMSVSARGANRLHPEHWRGYPIPITAPHVRDWAVTQLRAQRAGVWVVDPFGAIYTGDENSNSEVKAWLAALDEIKRRADLAGLVLVVHTGHGSSESDALPRARGAVRLMDWADALWTYRHGGKSGERPPDNRRHLSGFGRGVDLDEVACDYDPLTRRLLVVGRSDRRADRVAADVEKVCAVVAEAPGITKRDLEAKLGGHASDARAAVSAAVASGLVRIEIGPRNAQMHYPATGENSEVRS